MCYNNGIVKREDKQMDRYFLFSSKETNFEIIIIADNADEAMSKLIADYAGDDDICSDMVFIKELTEEETNSDYEMLYIL